MPYMRSPCLNLPVATAKDTQASPPLGPGAMGLSKQAGHQPALELLAHGSLTSSGLTLVSLQHLLCRWKSSVDSLPPLTCTSTSLCPKELTPVPIAQKQVSQLVTFRAAACRLFSQRGAMAWFACIFPISLVV